MAQTTTTEQTTKSPEELAVKLNVTVEEAAVRQQTWFDKSKKQ